MQWQLLDLQWVVTNMQAEATEKVMQKLEEEQGVQFRKKGNKKQFWLNQTIAHHLDAAKNELSKINPEAVNPSAAKNLEDAQAELDKG